MNDEFYERQRWITGTITSNSAAISDDILGVDAEFDFSDEEETQPGVAAPIRGNAITTGPGYNGAFNIGISVGDVNTEVTVPPIGDTGRYPQRCPKCGRGVYVGLNHIDHEPPGCQ
jgi:hypothetical protein